MPLLKINRPTLVVLGFERTLDLSYAFKDTGGSTGNSLDGLSVSEQCPQGQRGVGESNFCINFFKIHLDTEMSRISFRTRGQILTLSVLLPQLHSHLTKVTATAVPLVRITQPYVWWPSALTNLHGQYFSCQAESFPKLVCPSPRSRLGGKNVLGVSP